MSRAQKIRESSAHVSEIPQAVKFTCCSADRVISMPGVLVAGCYNLQVMSRFEIELSVL